MSFLNIRRKFSDSYLLESNIVPFDQEAGEDMSKEWITPSFFRILSTQISIRLSIAPCPCFDSEAPPGYLENNRTGYPSERFHPISLKRTFHQIGPTNAGPVSRDNCLGPERTFVSLKVDHGQDQG
jgi:hypothetical protein